MEIDSNLRELECPGNIRIVVRSFFLRKCCLLALAFALAHVQRASAEITIILDPVQKTLVFTGSDTGTPFLIPSQAFIGWRSADYTGTPQGFEFKAFSSSASTLEETRTMIFVPDSGSLISILIPNPSDQPIGPITVVADPTQIFAYGAVMSVAQAAAFEASVQNSTTIPLIAGTGYSPLNTQVIPEPGTGAMFGLAVAFLVTRRSRRHTEQS